MAPFSQGSCAAPHDANYEYRINVLEKLGNIFHLIGNLDIDYHPLVPLKNVLVVSTEVTK